MTATIKRNLIGATAVSTLLSLSILHAAMAPRMSLEQLVSRSEVIAQAQVVSSWPAWDAEHRYIWTHYQMRVTDPIRGAAGNLVVSEPGGSLDGVFQGFSGMTGWTAGENVIVFLHHVPNGYLRTTGGQQGVARISAEGRVALNLREAVGVTPEGTDLRTMSGLSLADFKTRLRGVVERNPLRGSAQ